METGYIWGGAGVLVLQSVLLFCVFRALLRNFDGRKPAREHYIAGTIAITPVIDQNGQAACLVAVDQNTAIKTGSQEIKPPAPEDCEQAAAEKPPLSSRMFHDLNQPLNSIRMTSGGITFLLNQGKKISDEELMECMKEISCQTDRIAAMVKGLKK